MKHCCTILRTGRLLRRPATAGLLAPCLVATGVLAQTSEPAPESESNVLPEVTVTLERAESVLRRTPISAGIVDAREIERKGIAQLNDLVGTVSGVSVPNGFGNMPQAVGIRGVGVSIPAMSQAVGIYIDDVPLVRGYATALWDLPDIQRIEVLRGPQGTLYGQNSSAGAVKYISLDPSSIGQAWVSVGAGNHEALELRGYASGRIGSGPLLASLAASHRRHGGYGYNATLDRDVNKLEATQFRGKFRWEVGPGTQAILSIDGLRDTSDTNTLNYPLNQPNSRPRVTYTGNPDAGPFERNAGGVSFKLEHLLPSGSRFRSITAYRAYKDDPTYADFGGLEALQYQIQQTVEQKVLSQELQLQGRDADDTWTTGLMFVGDTFRFARYVDFAPPAPAPLGHTEARTRQKTLDLGLYGQWRHALSESTGITGGLRLYRTRQEADNAFWRTDADRQRTQTVYTASDLETSKTGLLPRVVVDHQWSPELYLYGSIAQGAKFGGFNRAAESLVSARTASSPEKVTTLELGGKARLLAGRLDASAALFFNDFRDYLANLSGVVINGVLVTDSVLVNAGKAKTYGVDLDLTARLTDRLDWTVSMELLNSRFDEFANPSGSANTNYVGNQLPWAPHVSAGSTISYRLPMASGASASVYLTGQHIGRQYGDVANNEATRISAQNYVHLGGSFTDSQQRWTFSMRVRNLFDKTYVLLHNRIPPLGLHSAYYNAPRTIVFTARHDF